MLNEPRQRVTTYPGTGQVVSRYYINDASIIIMHRCIMHVRLSEKHGLGASCYKYRGAH